MDRNVKALMVMKGVKQVDICEKLSLTPGTVSGVVSGARESARVKKAIASALGMRVSELWPNNNSHRKAA